MLKLAMLIKISFFTIFWLILYDAGHSTFSLILSIFGIICALIISRYLNGGNHAKVTINYVRYFLWLIKEICISSIQVTKIIWSKKISDSDKLVLIDVDLKGEFKQVIYANSITLTPGTLTIDIANDKFLIHALDDSFAINSNNSMINKIKLL